MTEFDLIPLVLHNMIVLGEWMSTQLVFLKVTLG